MFLNVLARKPSSITIDTMIKAVKIRQKRNSIFTNSRSDNFHSVFRFLSTRKGTSAALLTTKRKSHVKL